MPARDGTGPYGTGPVGRRLGPCFRDEQEYDQPFGMGRAHRWGGRFGNRRPRWGWGAGFFYRDAESEFQVLQDRQNWLKEQLDAVTREIESRSKPSE